MSDSQELKNQSSSEESEKKVINEDTTKTTDESYRVIKSRDADVTLKFLEENDALVPEITPEQEKKLRKKVMIIIVGLTSLVDLILYSDKAVASYASIFGFWEDTGLTQNKYNNSNTLFYAGYIIGQLNIYLLQKIPLGKLLTVVTFLWAVIIFLHCTLHNFQGVYAIRFFLGFVESIALPILNTTMGQFLTKEEKAATAPIFYSTCLGVTIPVGFIAYGIFSAKNPPIPEMKKFGLLEEFKEQQVLQLKLMFLKNIN
ncbi:unnamed protein product [[Candida] boidinii]|uniref:Unnamed protein product n=1 Tax=Candida boidinii TaxID=5477 RepID=A0A9W6T654_CANBO|nr:unnamed protein product [[Candida] boidinii]